MRELRAWLYRIAHNTALNNLKRAGYDYDELRESLEHDSSPEDDLERRTVIRETLAGVAALPENQREALLRTAVGGSSQAEIARDLGVSDGAVRQLVHRARATLRAAATAITPLPLAAWAANASSAGGQAVSERIGELAAGAGTAGVGGLLLKGGAAVVVAGAIAAPATVHHVRSGDSEARAAQTTRPATTTATEQAPQPVTHTTLLVDGKQSDKRTSEDSSGHGKGGRDDTEDHSGSDRNSGGSDNAGHGDDSGSGSSEDKRGGNGGAQHVRHRGSGGDDTEHSGSPSGGDDGTSGSGGGGDSTDQVQSGDPSDPGSGDGGTGNDRSGSGEDSSSSGSGSGGDRSGSDDSLPHD